jgi:hypothetical protein
MRTTRTIALAAAIAATTLIPTSAYAAQPQYPGAMTLAVYGDAPYGTNPTDTAEFQATPAFIASVNADPDVSLVLHVGDIHSGKQYCTQAYDQSIARLWTGYADPLVYTPGDNEWTDCHKAGEGGGTYNATTGQVVHVTDPATGQPVDYAGGDPLANLNLIRSTLFANPGQALGGGNLHVLSQAQAFDPSHPADAKFVENVIFERKDTLFVTLNIPGGSNNDQDPWYGAPSMSAAQAQEVAERSAADLRWLDFAFQVATRSHDKAVVIQSQADMWDLDGNTTAHLSGYEQFVSSIAAHTLAFGKPVLALEGDSHTYRSDNPLAPNAPCTIESGTTEIACSPADFAHPGYNVPNFHRVVVHGSTFPLEWLKLTIQPEVTNPTTASSFGPFSWVRQTQH